MTIRHLRFDARFESTSAEITISGDIPTGAVTRLFGGPEELAPVPVRLQSPVLRYEWDDPQLSMSYDYAALLSVMSFLPVISGSPGSHPVVTFGWPVSDVAISALTGFEPSVEFESDSRGVPTEPQRESVLSLGGGIDSTAVQFLFPDTELVHEVPLEVRSGRMRSAVFERYNGRDDVTFIYTNQRQLYDVWGLGAWVAVFAGAFLMRPDTILSGLNTIDNSFLRGFGGRHMRTRHLRWYRLVRRMGPRLTTLEYLTSLCNAKIVAANDMISETVYCPSIRMDDCASCSKCIQRRILFELVDPGASPRPLSLATPTARTLADLGSLDHHRPHIAMLGVERSQVPAWISTRVYPRFGHLVDGINFQERYLASAITASGHTEDEKRLIERRLASWGISRMTKADREEIAAISPGSAEVVLSENFVDIAS